MISITLYDKNETALARALGSGEALLCADRVYTEGDYVEITGPRHLLLQADQALPWGEVFLPDGRMTWRVPFAEHRLAYPPGCFEAPRHILSAREMTREQVLSVRCLSRNPADLRGDTDFYPHCTANVETRNEACFCARNVVDGLTFNTFHGAEHQPRRMALPELGHRRPGRRLVPAGPGTGNGNHPNGARPPGGFPP